MAKDRFATSELNFTYYLGAGASAEALPVINNMSERFRTLAKNLEIDKGINPEYSVLKNTFINTLYGMSDEAFKFGTIDTYIKFLFLTDRTRCDTVKNVLAFFFLYEQIIKKLQDKRPLIFLTSVMQYGAVFPSNINIISWNYDFQIELAGEVFKNEKFIRSNGGTSHSPPLINYYPNSTNQNQYIQLVHLNGIAGLYLNNKSEKHNSFLNSIDTVNDLFESFQTDHNTYTSFAWESEHELKNQYGRFQYANSIMSATDVLIIVGYSFPYFNRNVDSVLIKNFISNPRQIGYKKIYFQDPVLDGSYLRAQFNINEIIEIIPLSDVINYYIPKDL